MLYDGATDSSITEVEIVYIRFLQHGSPKDVLVGLQELEHAHADGVFEAITRAMEDFIGPNWLDKVVGIGSDGASVNIGARNSVATRFRNARPYIIPVHCVAHRLELGVLQAVKDNDMMATVLDLLKKIHKHYHYSPKALRELKAVAEVMEEKIIKPTRLQGTRWMPHVQKASKALIQGFRPIVAHFQHVSQARPGEATAEVRGRATFISNKLKDFRVLKFLFFIQDLLDVVARLSLRFQENGLTCVDFLQALEAANLELIDLGQNPGQQFATFITTVERGNGVYQGFELTHYNANHAYNFVHLCELVIQCLENRLDNPQRDVAHGIINAGRVFDTREWPATREELAIYGNDQVDMLAEHFQPVLARQDCDMGAMRREWAAVKANLGHRGLNNQRQNLPNIGMLFLQQDERFPNIRKLIEIILVLPMSTAVCERGFSTVKRIKSDWRCRLHTEMMNHLLQVSVEGPTLHDYVAERAVHLWWTGGNRARRPLFVDPGHDEVPVEEEDELLNYIMFHNEHDE